MNRISELSYHGKKAIILVIITCLYFSSIPMVIAVQPDWNLDPHLYEHSMTVTGVVFLEDTELTEASDSVIVAAFIKDQCRGIATASYYSFVDRRIATMMIYANGDETGEEISFRFYHIKNDQVVNLENKLNFYPDDIIGDFERPYTWGKEFITGLYTGDQDPKEISLYPNPVVDKLVLNCSESGKEFNIRIVDRQGKLIIEDKYLHQGIIEIDVGKLDEGMYFIIFEDKIYRTAYPFIKVYH